MKTLLNVVPARLGGAATCIRNLTGVVNQYADHKEFATLRAVDHVARLLDLLRQTAVAFHPRTAA